jgi:hypothetical protein
MEQHKGTKSVNQIVFLLLIALPYCLTAAPTSSLASDSRYTTSTVEAVENGQLPLIWFQWNEELQGAFGPEGDLSLLEKYPDLRSKLTFYRGDTELRHDLLEHYLGSPAGQGDTWLPSFLVPDPYAKVLQPEKVNPESFFTIVGGVAGFFGGVILASALEPGTPGSDPNGPKALQLVLGLSFMTGGAGAGFLLDKSIESHRNHTAEAQYREEIRQLEENLPEPRSHFPENFQNMQALLRRIQVYNGNILSNPTVWHSASPPWYATGGCDSNLR